MLTRVVPYTQAGNVWIQLAEAHAASGVCLSTAELHAHNVHDHKWAWQQCSVQNRCGPADTSVDLLVNCYSIQLFRWRMSWLAVSLWKLVMTDELTLFDAIDKNMILTSRLTWSVIDMDSSKKRPDFWRRWTQRPFHPLIRSLICRSAEPVAARRTR